MVRGERVTGVRAKCDVRPKYESGWRGGARSTPGRGRVGE